MQRPKTWTGYFLYLLPFILFACSKPTPDHTSTIPKEAGWVAAYDVKAIAEKGKLTEASEYQLLQRAKKGAQQQPKEIRELVNAFMKDPLSLGVDLSKNVFSFYYQKGSGKESEGRIGFLASIRDRSSFKKNVDKILKGMKAPDEVKVEEEKGRSFLYLDGVVLAWDNGRLLALNQLGHHKDEKALKKKQYKEVHRLFDLKKKKSLIGADEDFQKFMERRKDISNWIAMDRIPEEMQEEVERIPMDGTGTIKESTFHTYLAFKPNAIELTHFNNNSKVDADKRFDRIMKDGVDKSLMSFLPKETYMGLGVAFDPDAAYKIAKKQTKGSVEETKKGLEKKGVSLDKMVASLSGDFIAAINDFGTYKRTVTDFVKKKSGEGGFGGFETVEKTEEQLYPKGSILLKTRTPYIKKQLEKRLSAHDSVKSVGNYYRADMEGYPPLFVGCTEDKIIFGSHEESVKKLFDGGYASSSLADSRMGSMFASNPSSGSMILDLQEYPKVFQERMKKGMGSFTNSLNILKRLDVQNIEKNGMKATLTLKEGEGNSLYRILKKADENAGGLMRMTL